MYTIHYENVSQAHDFPAVIKLLAREFLEGATYFSVGKWLENLSQYDLDLLMGLVEAAEFESHAGQSLVLLTALLTQGEGLAFTDELAEMRVGVLSVVLACESLYRKGEIEFDRNGVSFGEDELRNVIAWRKGQPRPQRSLPEEDD